MSDLVSPPEREWTVGTPPGKFASVTHGIALFRRPLEFLNSLPAHGDLVTVRLGPLRVWVVCHPALVHEMLRDTRTYDKGGTQYDRLRLLMGNGVVTCPHAEHRGQRRLVQPAFRPSRVAEYTALMAEEAEAVSRGWRAGQRVDISGAMLAMTTRVVSRVLFSDFLDAARAAEVRRCLADVVHGLFLRTVVPFDAVFRLPTPGNRRYRQAVTRLHALVDEVIAERLRGTPRDDVLGDLLAAAPGVDGTGAAGAREVHDQLITLLLTGAESTALGLASAFGLLADDPRAERLLHAELDTVLAGRALPAGEDLSRLTYTRAVVTETLRHSPPGWLFTRVTTRDTELAGQRLPAGSMVLYSPYLLHHDPANFPDPDRFRPERWLPGRDTSEPRQALIPFSAGSRKCLGDAFAMAETVVALAVIAGRWRLLRPPGPVEPPRPAATLGPRSLILTCAPRADRPAAPPPDPLPDPPARAACPAPDARTAGGHGVHDA